MGFGPYRAYREGKCVDTIGTVLVSWAGYFLCPKYKYIFQIRYIQEQFYQTSLGSFYGLKLAQCQLHFEQINLLCYLL